MEGRLGFGQKYGLIREALRGLLRFFALGLLFSALNMIFNALLPQVIRTAVDCVLGGKAPSGLMRRFAALLAGAPPARALGYACAAVLAVAAARCASIFLQRLFLAYGSEGFVKALRDRLFGHIQKLGWDWHRANSAGDIIQRCTSDVEVIRSLVCNQLIEVVRTTFLVVLFMSIMFSMNFRVALVTLIFIPVMGASSGIFYGLIGSRFREADEAEGELTSCAQESFTGVRVVKAFGRESAETERFAKKNARFSELWIRLGKLLSVYWASGTLLTCLQMAAVIIAGTVETVHGRMTLGDFIVFVSYSETLAWPVRSLGRELAEMSKAGVSLDRVGYILLSPPEEDEPDAQDAELRGDIEFRNVGFGYGGQKVLDGVSFTVPEGSVFGILGATGSGKTTITNLLDRLCEPSEGQILIGGRDIRSVTRQSLRRCVALATQEPFLFSRSIADNILAAAPNAARDELSAAARAACLDEAADELPKGLDTVVGERGVTLSGGQKQRVAMARALIRKSPILVFDDSLSAVDAETDAKIREALHVGTRGRTVILISHRITTLMQSDAIMVLEGGRVADIGTHAELISRPGLYRDIYEIQLGSGAEGGGE